MKEPIEPTTSDKQRGIGVAELLSAVATLGVAVLVGDAGRSQAAAEPG